MRQYATRFGSLLAFERGGVDAIDDDPTHQHVPEALAASARRVATDLSADGPG